MQAKSRLPLAFSVPKGEDQRNEDSFHRSAKGVYALSDGASVSFDSASWARILDRAGKQRLPLGSVAACGRRVTSELALREAPSGRC